MKKSLLQINLKSLILGAIAGAVIVLAKRQLMNAMSIAIAIIAVVILVRFKVQEPLV